MADDLAERVFLILTLGMLFNGQDPERIASRYAIDLDVVAAIQAAEIEKLPTKVLHAVLATVERANDPISASSND